MSSLRTDIEKEFWKKRDELDQMSFSDPRRKALLEEIKALADQHVFLTQLQINCTRKAWDDLDKGKSEPST